MKKYKSNKFYSIVITILSLSIVFVGANAQEYDDMYFNKSDRKKIKTSNKAVLATDAKTINSLDYNKATQTTEVYSAKNVNPEYIARYKATEANEVNDATPRNGLTSEDYFVENYDTPDSEIGSHQNQIDYAALNKRDQMSNSNQSSNFNNPFWGRSAWGFNPYIGMGFGWGSPFGFDPFMMNRFGYDPFMMGGFGPGMTIGMSYGFGTGFFPSMSYNMAMSYGMGFNPWGGWGAFPYNPYRMRGFYDPWAWGNPAMAFGGFNPYSPYGFGGVGLARPYGAVMGSDLNRRTAYQARSTNRSATTRRISSENYDSRRVSSTDSRIRVPNRATSNAVSNGRVSRDYSKTQNEYYRSSRSSSSSAANQRISTSSRTRNSYTRSSGSSTRYNASSISNTRPSRISNSSSGYNRSSGTRSSYSGYSNGSRSNSFSSPSRSSSGFNRSSYSSGGSRSSYSSGSSSGSRSSSGGSRSSGRR